MNPKTVPFTLQKVRWPQKGRVILAQSDADSVFVYQAYSPSIGHFAAQHGYFGGGGFSLTRTTWIKPNFLWMMYRSGWGTKEGQEVTLAIRLARTVFEEILATAVPSSFDSRVCATNEDWKQAVAASNVRLQWDPDHGPAGNSLERRAIQLGLRGPVAEKHARDWILDIEDISEFADTQRTLLHEGKLDQLVTPAEEVYAVRDSNVAAHLELDNFSA